MLKPFCHLPPFEMLLRLRRENNGRPLNGLHLCRIRRLQKGGRRMIYYYAINSIRYTVNIKV